MIIAGVLLITLLGVFHIRPVDSSTNDLVGSWRVDQRLSLYSITSLAGSADYLNRVGIYTNRRCLGGVTLGMKI